MQVDSGCQTQILQAKLSSHCKAIEKHLLQNSDSANKALAVSHRGGLTTSGRLPGISARTVSMTSPI